MTVRPGSASKMVRGLTSDSDDSDAPPPRPVVKKKPKRRYSAADPLATSESLVAQSERGLGLRSHVRRHGRRRKQAQPRCRVQE